MSSKMEVTLIDKMGNDLSVVNAARISFSKRKDAIDDKDKKLIKYLANNGHWSPFAHTALTLHIRAPFFVARQLQKHQVGLAWNEISRRYVDNPPEFYTVDIWRKRAANKKQGSSNETTTNFLDNAHLLHKKIYQLYDALIESGVAPEQARMVLPMSTYTEWYWTGSVYAFARVYQQRTDTHAQKETQEIAHMIGELLSVQFPLSWTALCG